MAGIFARSSLLFGKIVTPDKYIPQAVKVCIDEYVMDQRLKMYFKEKNEVYAFDTTKECSEGDYVIIREFPESEDKNIKFNVEKVIYKRGNFIDPLTGKRSAFNEYIDDISRITKLFGTERSYQKSDSNL